MPARKSAPAAEALAQSIEFEFRGAEFAVLPTTEWSLDALEAFEDGKLVTLLREVLTDGGYAAMKAVAPKVGDLNEFVAAMTEALGISGN